MLGTDYILDALSAEGIDHLFLVPGGLVDPFLPALGRQTTIRPIVAAQEGGAAYMADGYARASGNFGAALCIGGPGLGNTVTPIAAAATDGSPVLLLSGEVATALEGLGIFQDASSQTLDDVAVMKPVTVYSSSVDNPRNLAHLFRRALLEMWRSSRPVHLSLPTDTQTAAIDAKHSRIDSSIIHPSTLSRRAARESLRHLTGEAAGRPEVAVARPGVAARMVMREQDSGAAVDGGIGDDRAKREDGAVVVAFVAGQVNAAGFVVDVRHPQTLTRWIRIGHAACEEGTGSGKAVELQRRFGTLIAHGRNLWDGAVSAHLNRLQNGYP